MEDHGEGEVKDSIKCYFSTDVWADMMALTETGNSRDAAG